MEDPSGSGQSLVVATRWSLWGCWVFVGMLSLCGDVESLWGCRGGCVS